MVGITKLKRLDDDTSRVEIELTLSFPQPPPSAEQTVKKVKIIAEIPEDLTDPRYPLLSVENRVLEALSEAIFKRRSSINTALHSY